MYITADEFRVNLHGYRITDCAIRNARVFNFVVENEAQADVAGVLSAHKVERRVVPLFLDDPVDDRWGYTELFGFEELYAGAVKQPLEQFIGVDSGGQVYVLGSGITEVESRIPKGQDGPRRGAVRRTRTIDGRLYVAGTDHTVCRRRGRNHWESVTLDLPLPTRAQFENERLSEDMAFDDIDGFAHDDLYVVGGRGVVWHCDGQRWRRLPFPSNMFLESVCCGGDGQVYIGAQSGTLFRGRGDRWQMIERGEMSLPFKDIVWHAGRLWCTSDYGLWTLAGERLVKVDLPSEIAVCAGNLSAADGVMLMAGIHGAAFHDGERWHHIFNHYEMTQAVEEK